MQNAIEILKQQRDGLNNAIALLEGGAPAATATRTTSKKVTTTTATETKVEAAVEPKLEDVIKACQEHTAKNGGDRAPTIAIIEKFGVKNVQKLDPKHFKDILKELTA